MVSRKEAPVMRLKPITVHVAAMVDKLSDESTRAAYMAVKRLFDLEQPQNNGITEIATIQEKISKEDFEL